MLIFLGGKMKMSFVIRSWLFKEKTVRWLGVFSSSSTSSVIFHFFGEVLSLSPFTDLELATYYTLLQISDEFMGVKTVPAPVSPYIFMGKRTSSCRPTTHWEQHKISLFTKDLHSWTWMLRVIAFTVGFPALLPYEHYFFEVSRRRNSW